MIKSFLLKIASHPGTSRTLLFAGHDKALKEEYLYWFAAKLLADPARVMAKNHPDMHLFFPEGKASMHPDSSMRHLIDEVYLPPFQAPYKLFAIIDADRMLQSSANLLLKTLEEPAEKTIIILSAPAPTSLLPTILSRCQTLYFPSSGAYLVTRFIKEIIELMITPTHYPYFLQEIKRLVKEIEEAEVGTPQEKNNYIKEQSEALLRGILYFVRDIELLRAHGDPSLLFFKEHQELLKRAAALPFSLPVVSALIAEAKSKLERQTPLAIVLENLLIHLASM
jgi:DNA polymerase-3 subunit delta'